jgi:opacity protein-like surface antigen
MFRKCLFTALITCVPALGYTVNLTNWYMRVFAGYNLLTVPSDVETFTDVEGGYVVGGSVGYTFYEIVRLEAELSYRHNNADQLVFEGDLAHLQSALDGHFSSFAYMANALIDFPTKWILSPYFGIGLGGYEEWGSAGLQLLDKTSSHSKLKHKHKGGAYQAIAGVNFLHYKKIDCALDYRFLDTLSNSHTNHNHSFTVTAWKTF